jgi:hypothetical protein
MRRYPHTGSTTYCSDQTFRQTGTYVYLENVGSQFLYLRHPFRRNSITGLAIITPRLQRPGSSATCRAEADADNELAGRAKRSKARPMTRTTLPALRTSASSKYRETGGPGARLPPQEERYRGRIRGSFGGRREQLEIVDPGVVVELTNWLNHLSAPCSS